MNTAATKTGLNMLRTMDLESYFHPFTDLSAHRDSGPHVISSGDGVRIVDTEGKVFIDGMAGLWCMNLGYGRPEMVEAISAQAQKLSYYHSFASMGSDVSISLAARLSEIAPVPGSRILFGNSGSDANDTNLKLVRLYNTLLGRPNKRKVIVRRRAYHGSSMATAAASGLPTLHSAFDLPIGEYRRISPACYYWRGNASLSETDYTASLLQELEALIVNEGPDTIAAFLAEPVSGAGGVLVPPPGYWEGVQRLLAKYDILLILDEVITGFGRTGRMFAAETFNIRPDLMSVAKGLTSGYVPMSASFVSPEIWNTLSNADSGLGVFGHGYTYSGHPLAAAAAHASLDIMLDEGLADEAARKGAHLLSALTEEILPLTPVGDVRGIGLMVGVELAADWIGSRGPSRQSPVSRVAQRCREEGLIIRPLMDGNVLAISPPLVISHDDLDQLVAILKRAIESLST